jgi:formamidopyrimidine-DNA glycosylase
MPELPEVINFKRYIDSTYLHQKIQHVEVLKPDILSNINGQKLASA